MCRFRFELRLLAFLTFVLCRERALGQSNLVTNPGFDTDVAGWVGHDLTWDGIRDANDSSQSGSASGTAIFWFLPTFSRTVIEQCLGPVREGEIYTFGDKMRMIPTSPMFGPVSAAVSLTWYSGPGCIGTSSQEITPTTSVGGSWTSIQSDPVQAPAGAVSAKLEGLAWGMAYPMIVSFDDMYLRGADPARPAIPTLGLAGLSLFAALLAVLGSGLARTRLG